MFHSLRELYLWGNHIGNRGAKALASALETNVQLEALVMWNNKISDIGADALIKALDENLILKKLYLTGNEVRRKSKKKQK
jgi:NLR family CARD domain-containing protein 3